MVFNLDRKQKVKVACFLKSKTGRIGMTGEDCQTNASTAFSEHRKIGGLKLGLFCNKMNSFCPIIADAFWKIHPDTYVSMQAGPGT